MIERRTNSGTSSFMPGSVLSIARVVAQQHTLCCLLQDRDVSLAIGWHCAQVRDLNSEVVQLSQADSRYSHGSECSCHDLERGSLLVVSFADMIRLGLIIEHRNRPQQLAATAVLNRAVLSP